MRQHHYLASRGSLIPVVDFLLYFRMLMRQIPTLLLLVALLPCGMPAAAPAQTTAPSAPSTPKMDRLVVYGDGFAFGVKEPEGWHGDTTENVERYGANVLFYRPGVDPGKPEGVIRVRISKKADEDTAADLKADMDGYRKQFPKVEFRELSVFHPQYRVLAKEFTVPGEFHEYVAYVNPGPRLQYIFSVALNTGATPATDAELAALRTVIASLAALPTK